MSGNSLAGSHPSCDRRWTSRKGPQRPVQHATGREKSAAHSEQGGHQPCRPSRLSRAGARLCENLAIAMPQYDRRNDHGSATGWSRTHCLNREPLHAIWRADRPGEVNTLSQAYSRLPRQVSRRGSAATQWKGANDRQRETDFVGAGRKGFPGGQGRALRERPEDAEARLHRQ